MERGGVASGIKVMPTVGPSSLLRPSKPPPLHPPSNLLPASVMTPTEVAQDHHQLEPGIEFSGISLPSVVPSPTVAPPTFKKGKGLVSNVIGRLCYVVVLHALALSAMRNNGAVLNSSFEKAQ